MNHVQRVNGDRYTTEYLLTPNREVAESVLWPVPVLPQEQDGTTLRTISVSAGDVLESLSEHTKDYILVIAVPPAVGHESEPGRNAIVGYSTARDAVIELPLAYCEATTPEWVVPDEYASAFGPQHRPIITYHDSLGYAVHEDVVEPLDDDPLAAVSQIQKAPAGMNNDRQHPDAYYPYSNPPRPPSPSYPTITTTVESDSTLSESAIRDQLFVGDAADTLAQIPDDTAHAWITSPPYPGAQRDYGIDGQIGVESTVDGYLKDLLDVIRQAMRVTRPDGTGWLIIDDTVNDGQYAGVPDRLVAQLKLEGYDVIHNGPWVKTQTTPDPAPNRFAHTHERVIGIANEESYFFHRNAVDDQTDVFTAPTSTASQFNESNATDTPHDAKFSVELVEHILRVVAPNKTCPECGAPFEPVYEVSDILNLDESRPQCVNALDAFHESDLTRDHARACRAVGLSHTGQAARVNDGAGKNSDEVEQLLEEVRESSFPNSYIREFQYAQKDHTGYEQTCSCKVTADNTRNGLVLDPFVGSGTTCVAASRNGHHYTGIDLNPEYVESARNRLASGVDSSLTQFSE